MGKMQKIVLVEDDPLIARIYRRKLEDAGFQVLVAGDGLSALKLLPEFMPELIVLDIMLPKLNGVDVLKFVRQHPQLKSTRVVVFSNAFLNDLWDQITALGVQEILLKSSVNPPQLVQTVQRILQAPVDAVPVAGQVRRGDATPAQKSKKVERPVREAAAPVAYEPLDAPRQTESATGFIRRIRGDFVEQIPAITNSLRQAGREFLDCTDPAVQPLRLEDLCRKVGFLIHMTSMAGWHRLAQLSSAFEALLYEIQLKPAGLNDSTRHTISSTVSLLTDCLARGNQADEQCLSPTTVLVVDDDAVTSRALTGTLERMNVKATSVADPLPALELLRRGPYDAVLFDINLPNMSGFMLTEEMRKLPHHAGTPVIFITLYSEFEPRARSILNAGDDLISKPVMPIELTVKVIAHVLKHRLAKLTPVPQAG
jgi:CheY-like chemotaxis protein